MAHTTSSKKKPAGKAEQLKTDQVKGAAESILREVFYDMYQFRRKVYVMNLLRGIFFGFGSVLGGTIVVAAVIWLLSLFSDTWFGPFVERVVDIVRQSEEVQ